MPAQFGAKTDHFGILDIADGVGTLGDVLEIIDSSATPDAQSRADATDENGDIAAATWHGNTDGALQEASSTFVLKGASLDTAKLVAGEIEVGKIITSIEVATSNGDWPKITVSGKIGTKAVVAPPLLKNTWKFPTFTITGAKRAQLLGFTVGEDCKLSDSSISGSVDIAQHEDGVGEPIMHGVSGGMLTMSANLTAIEAAASWTHPASWTETQKPGTTEGQAAYHTASVTAESVWEREPSE